MDITEKSLIGDVVAKDYRYASVFQSAGIDFCCHGNRSIGEACDEKKLAAQQLLSRLEEATTSGGQAATDFTSWPLDLLADYIQKRHHRYVEEKTSELKPYLEKIVNVHGSRHPELAEIKELFGETAGELAMHMKKEELILFPFIRKMEKAKQDKVKIGKPHFGSIRNPIESMMAEHDNEGDRFRKIEELSNGFTPPEDACNTYRVTLAMLKEFEQDLHLHIHLENNILFPKSIELEKNVVL